MDNKDIKRIAILGTRGIPNRYGGFEQFAGYLAPGLVRLGWEVYVYCPHHHPEKLTEYEGVQLIYCFDPEPFIGPFGQIIYDLICILDSRFRSFDLIYQLGYTTSGIWQALLPAKSTIVSNMDGMEWSRSKYGSLAKKFLLWSEKKVVNKSSQLVADAIPIKSYLDNKYKVNATYIAYGADIYKPGDHQLSLPFGLESGKYLLLIARMQPDNHIEDILQGVINSSVQCPVIVVGSMENRYGKYLKRNFLSERIVFAGGIYDQDILNHLRYHAAGYFHGHSAGGTNPSLLEAMASGARILAHDNEFNRSVLGPGAFYFSGYTDIAENLAKWIHSTLWGEMAEINMLNIKSRYQKDDIIEGHHQMFKRFFHLI